MDVTSEGIDIDAIGIVHNVITGNDGFIGFQNKRDGKMQNLCSIPVSELRKYLPQIISQLEYDSYMTVNSYYRPAPYPNQITGLPDLWRKEKNLRYLNACFVDLDVGRPDDLNPAKRIKDTEAIGKVIELSDNGIIPPPSIFARSGRGLYLFWLLIGQNGKLQTAFPNERRLYKEVNKEIAKRLESLGADKSAHDCARILRVPNSIHTGAHKPVKYMLPADGNAIAYTYTLNELAGILRISHRERIEIATATNYTLRTAINKGSCPLRRNGIIRKAKNRLQDVLKIEKYIDGFPKGKRRRSLFYVCYFMRSAGYTKEDALKTVESLAGNCKPVFPSNDDIPVARLVDEAYSGRAGMQFVMNNSVLAKFFIVDDEMVDFFDKAGEPLRSIIPKPVMVKRQRVGKQESILVRRRYILNIIQNGSFQKTPSIRAISMNLHNHGINVSKDTVNRDVDALVKEGVLSEWRGANAGRPFLQTA
ncbi:MAG: hypothetical protein WAX69_26705 [Victivallales bacterium]